MAKSQELFEQIKELFIEFETEQGDHNYMGFPDDTRYRAYQPYKALIR